MAGSKRERFSSTRGRPINNILVRQAIVLVLSETVLVLVLEKEAAMAEPSFDQERLDVYRVAIDPESNLRGKADLKRIVSM
jgi:hypothetical protein